MRVAVLNAGSATVKAAVADVEVQAIRLLGRASREVAGDADRGEAFREALREAGADAADAVGHRVVHGGRAFSEPVLVDAAVEREIDALARLAPQHNPPALEGIRVARTFFPDRPAVAVFDTAFHAGRPPEAYRYALPWSLSDELGLFRYGFHGIAHASLVEALAAEESTAENAVTAVTLQLGAGCSACAVDGGRSLETSMGYSPLEGLVMASRAGDVDPSLVLELVERGRSAAEVRDLLGRRSGLAGVAGRADMRAVLAAEADGDERAGVAVAMFVRRLVATVGAYLTLLGGRGSLVFGGGIGTHSAAIRQRVADGLRAWNVALDPSRNAEAAVRGRISPTSNRPVYVFETDEERRIARSVFQRLTPGTEDA